MITESKFFNKAFVHDYEKILKERALQEIERMPDEQFLEYDNETLVEYFCEKLNMNPMLLHDKENPLVSLKKQIDMEKEYNSWFGFGLPNQPEYREIKVENLYWEYSVRITGNTELAYLCPSVYSGSIGEDDYKDLSIKETRDDYDILIVKIKKSVQSVQNISNLKEEIYKIFLSKIS